MLINTSRLMHNLFQKLRCIIAVSEYSEVMLNAFYIEKKFQQRTNEESDHREQRHVNAITCS